MLEAMTEFVEGIALMWYEEQVLDMLYLYLIGGAFRPLAAHRDGV